MLEDSTKEILSSVDLCAMLHEETPTQTPSLPRCTHTMWYPPRLSQYLEADDYISTIIFHVNLSWGNCLHSIFREFLARSHGLMTAVQSIWDHISRGKKPKQSHVTNVLLLWVTVLILHWLNRESSWWLDQKEMQICEAGYWVGLAYTLSIRSQGSTWTKKDILTTRAPEGLVFFLSTPFPSIHTLN